jgi:hypothetical protein
MVSRHRAAARLAVLCSTRLIVGTLGAVLCSGTAFADPGNGQALGHRVDGTAATVGSTTEPQPNSTADDTGNGANGVGAYTSTRDGAPSLNGNGNGNSTGEPCAGCVGKADNKNPPGQYPDGSDPNAGYECDANKGVGQSNPAHTGCSDTTAAPPVATPTPLPCHPVDESCPPCSPATSTACSSATPAPIPPHEVLLAAPPTTTTAPPALAFTGSDISHLIEVALGAILAGLALIVASRRPAGQRRTVPLRDPASFREPPRTQARGNTACRPFAPRNHSPASNRRCMTATRTAAICALEQHHDRRSRHLAACDTAMIRSYRSTAARCAHGTLPAPPHLSRTFR